MRAEPLKNIIDAYTSVGDLLHSAEIALTENRKCHRSAIERAPVLRDAMLRIPPVPEIAEAREARRAVSANDTLMEQLRLEGIRLERRVCDLRLVQGSLQTAMQLLAAGSC